MYILRIALYEFYQDSSREFLFCLGSLERTHFNILLDQNQSPCRRNLCECDRDMAYKLLDEQYKWKKQLHDKFDFDRGNYCGRADVGGEFQFSQSFLPPVQEGKHRHQVKEIHMVRFSWDSIRIGRVSKFMLEA